MLRKITATIAILTLLHTPLTYARTTTKDIVFGEMAFGSVIAMMMHTECSEAAAPMWDMEQADRTNHYKCAEIFKGFKDYTGLALYKKADALAKKSYSELKRTLLMEQSAAGGSSEPPEGCDAHHIVPQNEGRPWAKDFADKSRIILKDCGIGINSAENGVFLPNGRSQTPGCEGQHHPSLHTREYYNRIYDQLDTANRNGTCDDVRNVLKNIKNDLINSKL